MNPDQPSSGYSKEQSIQNAVNLSKIIFSSLNFHMHISNMSVLIDFSLTVKAATLIFISGRGLAISSVKEGKSDSIYNLVKS